MKTEENMDLVQAERNNKTSKNDNWKVGVSMAIGAAIGASATTAMAQNNESEASVDPQPEPVPQPTPIPEPEPNPIPMPNPEPIPDPEPEPIPNPEPEITVLSYETVTGEDGNLMDVAVVEIEGETAAIIDVDRDGTADALIAGWNGNGIIDPEEVNNIEHQQISMADLAANVAQQPQVDIYEPVANNEEDYNNNGDINGYMA